MSSSRGQRSNQFIRGGRERPNAPALRGAAPEDADLAKGVRTQIFGLVTAGPNWQFGLLERGQKRITKDTEAFLLPRDVAKLVGIIVGLLGESDQDNVKREGEKLSWANN